MVLKYVKITCTNLLCSSLISIYSCNLAPMLSILIPVYNTKVVKLVKELHAQCLKAKIQFEILVFDDDSKPKYKQFNSEINGILGVNYIEFSENMGRSKIRNRLAKTAMMDHLLFLDADSKIQSKKFIKNYASHLKQNRIINGGRKYYKKPPKAKSKLLHWQYGTKQESRSAQKRNKVPSRYFHTNNFIGPRELILKHPFSEQIQGYGYEDILFGYSLEQSGTEILHIDNPVIHNDLEPLQSFVAKQEQALRNLKRISQDHPKLPIKILQLYNTLSDYDLQNIALKLLGSPSKLKESLLEKPSLWNLKKFRLAYCIELMKTD